MATNQSTILRQFFMRLAAGAGAAAGDSELLRRFVADHDEHAFSALVHRHGPMVLSVCKRVLRHDHDAEDAFQATFLVLARKARAIGDPNLLANWLHGVALRTALEARTLRAKRIAKEQKVPARNAEPSPEVLWEEVRQIIDEEIAQLPARCRFPFVLCYLEGKTNQEVAQLMNCPKGTIMSRLAWARNRLKNRLTRRGIGLSATAFVAILSETSSSAAIPMAIASSTAQTAIASLTVPFVVGTSAKAGALAQGVLKMMWWSKIKTASVVILMVAALGTGTGVATYRLAYGQAGGDGKKKENEVTILRKSPIPESDQKRIQGAWRVEESLTAFANGPVLDTKKVTALGLWKGMTIHFFDKLVQGEARLLDLRSAVGKTDVNAVQMGAPLDSNYRLDEVNKWIDLTDVKTGALLIGIYRLQGDALEIALVDGNQPRPTEFDLKAGGPALIRFTLQRTEPLLQGSWAVESLIKAGREQTGKRAAMVITEDSLYIDVLSGSRFALAGDWFDKGSKNLKIMPGSHSLDFTVQKTGMKLPGIYEVTADTLKICIDESGSERPTKMSANADTPNFVLITLTRQPDAKKWGVPADGVQVHLRLAKTHFAPDELITFSADIRNRGTTTYQGARSRGNWQVEIDGVWYREDMEWFGPVEIAKLKPGDQTDSWLNDSLSDNWVTTLPAQKVEKLAQLKPGKHTVRVRIPLDTTPPAPANGIMPVSNSVEFEVAAKEAAWGDAVEGVQVRLRVTKSQWEANEIPVFELDVRNQGQLDYTDYEGHSIEKCDIQIDGQWYSSEKLRGGYPTKGIGHQDQVGWITGSPSGKWLSMKYVDEKRISDLRAGHSPDVAPLPWTPGKHVVRMSYRFFQWPGLLSSVEPISNAVEIEILAPHPQDKQANRALQGPWTLVEMQHHDYKATPAELKQLKPFVFQGTTWQNPQGEGFEGVPVLENQQGGVFTVDTSKTPGTIDFECSTGFSKGEKRLGIFKIENDTLTLCVAVTPDPTVRPMALAPGRQFALYVFTRAKQ